MPSKEDRATATGNMHKTFGEVRPRGFRVMRADRQTETVSQTDGQAYSLQYFAILPVGEVIMKYSGVFDNMHITNR